MTRRMLPNRRACYTTTLRWYNTDYAVSISLFDDDAPAEVFITGAKAGSDVQAVSRDAAIVIRLALQFGCPLSVMHHAVTREEDGATTPIIGLLVEEMDREHGRVVEATKLRIDEGAEV